jgi:hypothetical protein
MGNILFRRHIGGKNTGQDTSVRRKLFRRHITGKKQHLNTVYVISMQINM